VKQHDLPGPDPLARDQWRAVAKLGDHTLGQGGVGLGHDLRSDRDVSGDREALKRAALGEGGEGFRLPPAHRAADGAPAGAQAHGHQGRLFAARQVAGRNARASKSQEQPAAVDPFGQRGLFAIRQRRHIGEHDHIGVGGQHIHQRASQQVGGRIERLFKVVQRRQKLEPLAIFAPRDQRHLAAIQRVIGEGDRPGLRLARDLETGDTGAQFGRQRQAACCLGRALVKGHRQGGQNARRARRIEAVSVHRDVARGAGAGAQRGQIDTGVRQLRGAQPEDAARAFMHGDRAACLERFEQWRAAGVVQPVGEPAGLERLIAQHFGGLGEGPGRGRPWGRFQPRQAAAHGACGLKGRCLGIAEIEDRGGAPGAARIGQKPVHHRHLCRPVAGARPACIGHDQKRTLRRRLALAARVEDRSGQPDDHRRHGQHAQQ